MATIRCPLCNLPLTEAESKLPTCAICGGALASLINPNPGQAVTFSTKSSTFGGTQIQIAGVLSPLIAFDNRLKAATPYFPVTFLVVTLNVLVFALMALKHHRVLHFNADILMQWGRHSPDPSCISTSPGNLFWSSSWPSKW
jgi:hypothetical protein